MPLADWDEVLRWLEEHGAPAWCCARRRDELADLQRSFPVTPITRRPGGLVAVPLRDEVFERLTAFRQPGETWDAAVRRLLDSTQGETRAV